MAHTDKYIYMPYLAAMMITNKQSSLRVVN
jgi:hypothetical protein